MWKRGEMGEDPEQSRRREEPSVRQVDVREDKRKGREIETEKRGGNVDYVGRVGGNSRRRKEDEKYDGGRGGGGGGE